MAEAPSAVQIAVTRDRRIIIASAVTLSALAWAYTAHLSTQPLMPMTQPWAAADFAFMLFMWTVMMVAMMLPSATPMMVLFAQVNRRRVEATRPFVPTAIFAAGYLVAWTTFSLAATLINWGLHQAEVLTSMMGRTTPWVAGALLLAAGIYQWTPFKRACLTHCRSPLGFLMAHQREGRVGAFATGMHHGVYCLGCCWLLMGLLFALGIMNLAWVAALAVFVLAEKLFPAGNIVARTAGVGLMGWGVWLLAV